MTPEQQLLVQRIRALLSNQPDVREVSMFGGCAIMVNDAMLVSAGKAGDLLVRVDADQHDALLSEPGAAHSEMGAGRKMGPGWIAVCAEAIATDERLSFWIGKAMSHNHAVTRPTPQ